VCAVHVYIIPRCIFWFDVDLLAAAALFEREFEAAGPFCFGRDKARPWPAGALFVAAAPARRPSLSALLSFRVQQVWSPRELVACPSLGSCRSLGAPRVLGASDDQDDHLRERAHQATQGGARGEPTAGHGRTLSMTACATLESLCLCVYKHKIQYAQPYIIARFHSHAPWQQSGTPLTVAPQCSVVAAVKGRRHARRTLSRGCERDLVSDA
jgi:hypothetical protein